VNSIRISEPTLCDRDLQVCLDGCVIRRRSVRDVGGLHFAPVSSQAKGFASEPMLTRRVRHASSAVVPLPLNGS